MGGLIIRETIYQVQNRASLGNGDIFPPTIGHVTDAITANTPHAGVSPLANVDCFGCQQLMDMANTSSLMSEWQDKGQDPQAGGTDWTLIAGGCDGLVDTQNATSMSGANHIIAYNTVSNNNTCYDHGGTIHDKSISWDSSQAFCDTLDPHSRPCSSQNMDQRSDGAHGPQAIYIAIVRGTQLQCDNNQCSGFDPYATYGSDGSLCGASQLLLQAANIPGGQVYLFSSLSCGTSWAMTIQTSQFQFVEENANVNLRDGNPNSSFDNIWSSATIVYSPMVFSLKTPAQACGSINNQAQGCTV